MAPNRPAMGGKQITLRARPLLLRAEVFHPDELTYGSEGYV